MAIILDKKPPKTLLMKRVAYVATLIKIKTPSALRHIIFMAKKASRISKVPAFVKKLLNILDDPNYVDFVSWVPQENGFHILNVNKFTQEVLPAYFKHQNMASFVRQLNMYGFNRTKDSQQHVYFHPKFKRGQTNLIKCIKRKIVHKGKGSIEESEEELESYNASEVVSHERILQEKHFELAKENEELRLKNQQLQIKIKQLENFKRNMEKAFNINKPHAECEKSQRENNNSISSSDKSSTHPPIIKKEQVQIINENLNGSLNGSSFGFYNATSLDGHQKVSYETLIKSIMEIKKEN